MRRFAPLALIAAAFAAVVALLAASGVDWDLGWGDAWMLLPLAALLAGGFAWGRWRALAALGVLPSLALALLLDAAWLTGVWDRSGEYEPLPTTPFMLLVVPVFVALVAFGVAVRRATRETG